MKNTYNPSITFNTRPFLYKSTCLRRNIWLSAVDLLKKSQYIVKKGKGIIDWGGEEYYLEYYTFLGVIVNLKNNIGKGGGYVWF